MPTRPPWLQPRLLSTVPRYLGEADARTADAVAQFNRQWPGKLDKPANTGRFFLGENGEWIPPKANPNTGLVLSNRPALQPMPWLDKPMPIRDFAPDYVPGNRLQPQRNYFVSPGIRPSGYPIHFEFELDRGDLGTSESVHFNRSNVALEVALRNDPALLDRLATLSRRTPADILSAVSKKGGRRQPFGFTWHHALTSQASRPGVMQLVLRQRHLEDAGFFHPDRYGGYDEWTRPAGAPPRRR